MGIYLLLKPSLPWYGVHRAHTQNEHMSHTKQILYVHAAANTHSSTIYCTALVPPVRQMPRTTKASFLPTIVRSAFLCHLPRAVKSLYAVRFSHSVCTDCAHNVTNTSSGSLSFPGVYYTDLAQTLQVRCVLKPFTRVVHQQIISSNIIMSGRTHSPYIYIYTE